MFEPTGPFLNRWLAPFYTGVDTRYMWHFNSEPEKELDGRSFAMFRGKVLGGSSSINGMIYLRGAPCDYDLWQQMGATGWSYDDVLSYFRMSENQSRGADAYHGCGGPLSVEDVRWRMPPERGLYRCSGKHWREALRRFLR